eukprot:TRINITY_DN3769_c0_g1_i1.p1 TRINITY_DN3769_c0_g1~~TRINITY_DN3769_c0_g1_i1.p1  ORF type:complete len:172 (-),score=49.81 TRINITY_DN3769_c0_g1_i1:18-512(-)
MSKRKREDEDFYIEPEENRPRKKRKRKISTEKRVITRKNKRKSKSKPKPSSSDPTTPSIVKTIHALDHTLFSQDTRNELKQSIESVHDKEMDLLEKDLMDIENMRLEIYDSMQLMKLEIGCALEVRLLKHMKSVGKLEKMIEDSLNEKEQEVVNALDQMTSLLL